MVGWRDLGFRSTLFFFSAHVFSSTVQQSVLVPAEPKITAQFCFVNYYHSYLNLSFLLFLLPSLSHYGVLSCPIAHLFCRLMQHIRHPSVFHHLDWSCLALCLGFCWSTVHAFMFVWVRDRQRDDHRLQTESSSCVSLWCRLFYPPLSAADVRTTYCPITSKGTSCIWTIRWGNAWTHGPLSSCLKSHDAFLLLWY